eukprot:6358732-Amphidinium_carterae.1
MRPRHTCIPNPHAASHTLLSRVSLTTWGLVRVLRASWMNKLYATLAYAASCHVKLLMPPCCNYATELSGFSPDAASLSRCKHRESHHCASQKNTHEVEKECLLVKGCNTINILSVHDRSLLLLQFKHHAMSEVSLALCMSAKVVGKFDGVSHVGK